MHRRHFSHPLSYSPRQFPIHRLTPIKTKVISQTSSFAGVRLLPTLASNSWAEFENRLGGFFAQKPLDRDRFIFRGQADENWDLTTTLDRFVTSNQLEDREEARRRLLDVFRTESISLRSSASDVELTLLARHHGLPSTIMDWTRSPYVAAFFAMRDPTHESEKRPGAIGVWCLDISKAESLFADNVIVIDEATALTDNPRAIEQKSVFLDVRHPFDWKKLVPPILTLFTIPTKERRAVLSRLDGMGINDRSLFRSLEAAAEVAKWRVRDMLLDEK